MIHILKLNTNAWILILDECKTLFDDEPVLELALAPVVKDVVGKRNKPAYKSFILRWALPYWFIFKTKVRSTKMENIMVDIHNNEKPFCVFGIEHSRENYYGMVYTVLKKIDAMGEQCILFTSFEIFNKKQDDLMALKNTSIIFYDNLLYEIKPSDILSKIGEANRLYKRLINETRNRDITDFVKQYKNETIFRLEEMLISTKILYNLFKDKRCSFIYSCGGYLPFALVGKQLGIRTVMIQHGMFGNVENPSEYGAIPPECSERASDELVMWGEQAKEKVKKIFKYDSTRKILFLGNPLYDEVIKKYRNKTREKMFYEKLGLDPEKKTVVMFSQTCAIDMEQGGKLASRFINPIYALDKLYDALETKINLLIKLHPYETKEYYEKYLNNIDKIKIIKSEYPLGEILQYTDISLSVSCTTTLEAMVFGIPTLQLILSEHGIRGENYADYGSAICIKNSDELIDTIDKMVSDEYDLTDLRRNQKIYLKNNMINLGNATNKIVEHLMGDCYESC